MTHISKQALTQEKQHELFEQFNTSICRLSEDEVSLFLGEFFGIEEKIMFAKRLASIIMCIEKNTVYEISVALSISPSTAARIKLKYQKGTYRSIEKLITKNTRKYLTLLKTLETILQAGLPPRGRGRWRRFFKER